jgi:hypothetical protein
MKRALQSPSQEYVFVVVTGLENESLMLFLLMTILVFQHCTPKRKGKA